MTHRPTLFSLVVALLAVQVLLGAPTASAAPFDCKEAPAVDVPGRGMAGAIDYPTLGKGTRGSVYDDYSYAGLVWHVYDVGCAGSLSAPEATTSTWIGNQLFNAAKVIVAATNATHYLLLDTEGLFGRLDNTISRGADILYQGVAIPYLALALIIVAVIVLTLTLRGNLSAASHRAGTAVTALCLIAATGATPLVYVTVLNDIVITGTSELHRNLLKQIGIEDTRNGVPTLIHDKVVVDNWLMGEFGSPEPSEEARALGRELLRAQACDKIELVQGKCDVEAKKKLFAEVANKTGSSYPVFTGRSGIRPGAGALALTEAVIFASFQLLAGFGQVLAHLLLRGLVLAGPVIGLVAMLRQGTLRGVGRAAGTALMSAFALVIAAAVHAFLLTVILRMEGTIMERLLLCVLITILLWVILQPVRKTYNLVVAAGGLVGTEISTWDQVRQRDAVRGRRRWWRR